MSRTIQSASHKALTALLVRERKAAGLTQADVAGRIGRYQSYVATIENGQRRVDVVEFLELARAIGFSPREAIEELADVKARRSRT